jgi:hypothetical protein
VADSNIAVVRDADGVVHYGSRFTSTFIREGLADGSLTEVTDGDASDAQDGDGVDAGADHGGSGDGQSAAGDANGDDDAGVAV